MIYHSTRNEQLTASSTHAVLQGIAPDGGLLPHAQVVRNVVQEAILADRVSVDFIGLGEHHRDDFAISAPDVVLGAIAASTERIRFGTAVTVLSSDDPIRVIERFNTLDALSNRRAEVILGRGSFTESRAGALCCRDGRRCRRAEAWGRRWSWQGRGFGDCSAGSASRSRGRGG